MRSMYPQNMFSWLVISTPLKRLSQSTNQLDYEELDLVQILKSWM